jgi:hypothetical protein
MRRRHEGKPIYGCGWLGDAAEEAAVRATAPARMLKDASTATAAMKARKNSAAGGARVPVNGGGVAQLSDDEYRQLAKQQYEAEGEIEIDRKARVSRSEDQTGETGAYVQAWVFVYRLGRG